MSKLAGLTSASSLRNLWAAAYLSAKKIELPPKVPGSHDDVEVLNACSEKSRYPECTEDETGDLSHRRECAVHAVKVPAMDCHACQSMRRLVLSKGSPGRRNRASLEHEPSISLSLVDEAAAAVAYGGGLDLSRQPRRTPRRIRHSRSGIF